MNSPRYAEIVSAVCDLAIEHASPELPVHEALYCIGCAAIQFIKKADGIEAAEAAIEALHVGVRGRVQ